MKQLGTIAVLILISISLKAQGNLQFNQVLLLDVTNPANSVTVPAGKVWKIESAIMNQNNSYTQLQIGGVSYYLSSTSTLYKNVPFWIPSGTSLGLLSPSGHLGKISIIEFNVVP